MGMRRDSEYRQELTAQVNELHRQYSKLEAYRQNLAEELRQVVQQRAQLKILSGAGQTTGSVLNLET
jgi:hypothetical protein